MSIQESYKWSQFSLVFAALSAILLLVHTCNREASKQPQTSEPHEIRIKGTSHDILEVDGCQYVHKEDCRNPIHWERVLQDTSWYHKVPKREKVDSK
jgi:hypothetical protein